MENGRGALKYRQDARGPFPGIFIRCIEQEARVFRDTESIAFVNDQGDRARKLFAAVVLAALDDAIRDEKVNGTGADALARWARSRDGREVLNCAGIDPTDRAIDVSLVQGITTAFLDAYMKQDPIAQEWLQKNARRWIGDRGKWKRK